ncbi:MAG: mechanosensitive ion channel [Gammaproteobacteria bacterium]
MEYIGIHPVFNVIYSWVPRLAGAIIIFILFYLGASFVKRLIIGFSSESPEQKYIFKVLAQLAKIMVLAIGTVTSLGSAGVNVSALVTSLGLSGFALTFATKELISNVISGFLILFYRPFHIGDYVTIFYVSGVNSHGIVEDINLRYTSLISDDNTKVLVPNSLVLTNHVKISNPE